MIRPTSAAAIVAAFTLLALPLRAQTPAPASAPEPKVHKAERLFSTNEPLAFTLVADFNKAFKNRDTVNVPETPATIRYTDSSGKQVSLPIQISPRGHFRIKGSNCSFPPLRVRFDKEQTKGTIFRGQKSLKLGTHCRDGGEYEQIPLREHLIYRAYNLVTERSFLSRLAHVSYMDVRDSLKPQVRWGLWIESEDGLGKRNASQVKTMKGALFDDLDKSTTEIVGLFEYLIGNTDFSLYALHNMRLMQGTDGTVYPVAYDFDFSGLANTRYSTPDPRLPIKRVQERLFRMPCRKPEEIAGSIEVFKSKEKAILALYDSLPPLDKGYQRYAKDYIRGFYDELKDKGGVKQMLNTACDGKGSV